MLRRPPRSTRTDTLFPYTTLFRSLRATACIRDDGSRVGNSPSPTGMGHVGPAADCRAVLFGVRCAGRVAGSFFGADPGEDHRSEEHTSELQSLMRTSYAVVCLKNKIHH